MIKFYGNIWEIFSRIIEPIFLAGIAASGKSGKKVDTTRLAPARGWLLLFHLAFEGGPRDRLLEIMGKKGLHSDPAVSAAAMFYLRYLPLCVLLSNAYDASRSASVATRRMSFDLLFHVLLPCLALSFEVLGSSSQYRDYCVWCVLLLEHWKRSFPYLFTLARDCNGFLLNAVGIEWLHAYYTSTIKSRHLVRPAPSLLPVPPTFWLPARDCPRFRLSNAARDKVASPRSGAHFPSPPSSCCRAL